MERVSIELFRHASFQLGILTKVDAIVKLRDVNKLLEADGWNLVGVGDSDRQYEHSTKAGQITVAGKMNHDLAPGTLNSLLKQAGLKGERHG